MTVLARPSRSAVLAVAAVAVAAFSACSDSGPCGPKPTATADLPECLPECTLNCPQQQSADCSTQCQRGGCWSCTDGTWQHLNWNCSSTCTVDAPDAGACGPVPQSPQLPECQPQCNSICDAQKDPGCAAICGAQGCWSCDADGGWAPLAVACDPSAPCSGDPGAGATDGG